MAQLSGLYCGLLHRETSFDVSFIESIWTPYEGLISRMSNSQPLTQGLKDLYSTYFLEGQ